MLRKITLMFLAGLCIKNTVEAQSSRLAALHRTYFTTSWNPFDSATFIYSNGRGGEGADFESQQLKHDTAYFRNFHGSNWQPYYIEKQTFDNNNRITERIKMNWNVNSNTYVNAQKTSFTYDASGNVLETINANWSTSSNSWLNQGRIERTYDANNNLLTYLYQTWTNNAWQNNNSNIYLYTSNDDVLYNKHMIWNITTNQWDSNTYWQYYYTNNLQDSIHIYSWSGGWQPSARFHLGYDINSKPNFRLYQQWSNNTWINSSQSFITYAPQYSGDSSQTWNSVSNNWENSFFYSFNFDANNKPLRYLLKNWDATNGVWVNELVDSTTYNSFGQKETYKRLSWIASTQTWGGKSNDNVVRYYYEMYTNDVKDVTNNLTELQLYPVPAGNSLYVAAQFKTAEDFKIAIYDMQGRILKQWGEKGSKSYSRLLPLADLPSGTYILQISGPNAKSQEQFTVIK